MMFSALKSAIFIAAQAGLPGYVLQDQVEIMTPKGVRLVRNPLKGYVFQGDVAEGNAGISRGVSLPGPA